MSDAYGFLAPIYQPLSRLVFGNDLIYANQAFLEDNSVKKLLIIGGGDGIAYRDFAKKMNGEYWDLSPKMIHFAKLNLKDSGLEMHVGPWNGLGEFDRIYLPFVLDTLPDEEIGNFIQLIKSALLPRAEVVLSDFFDSENFSQKLTQKFMISFFRVFTAHRRKNLPNIYHYFKSEGFELIKEKTWRKGWIRAQVWQPL